MPKLVTENNYMNRKNRFMAYSGAAVTLITVLFSISNSMFQWGIDIPQEHIQDAVAGGMGVVAFIMTMIGYMTAPGKGDGIKEKQ